MGIGEPSDAIAAPRDVNGPSQREKEDEPVEGAPAEDGPGWGIF